MLDPQKYPIQRSDGRAMGDFLLIYRENWPRYNATVLYYSNRFDSDMEANAEPIGYSTYYMSIWLMNKTAIFYAL